MLMQLFRVGGAVKYRRQPAGTEGRVFSRGDNGKRERRLPSPLQTCSARVAGSSAECHPHCETVPGEGRIWCLWEAGGTVSAFPNAVQIPGRVFTRRTFCGHRSPGFCSRTAGVLCQLRSLARAMRESTDSDNVVQQQFANDLSGHVYASDTMAISTPST